MLQQNDIWSQVSHSFVASFRCALFVDAETWSEMKELNNTARTGSVDKSREGVDKDTCQGICMEDNLCVAAMYSSSSKCFIYHIYSEESVRTQSGTILFKKEEITSTGAVTI